MSTYYNPITASGVGFTLTPEASTDRPKTPKGLIVTQAVQTRAGWLGQVFVDKNIVFESAEPHEDPEGAIGEANERVVATVSKLFAAPEAP